MGDGHVLSRAGVQADELTDMKHIVRQQNYQIMVEDREKGLIPVFPAMPEDGIEMLLMTLENAIARGHPATVGWANPHKVPILTN